jgi:hypothetical protein
MANENYKKNALIPFIIVVFAAGIGAIFTAFDNVKPIPTKNYNPVNINDTFLYSTNWDEPDPFEPINIDTVTVIDIKKDYVLYEYKWNKIAIQNSTPLKSFKKNIKQISRKK